MQQHYPVPGRHHRGEIISKATEYCRIGGLLGLLLVSIPASANLTVNITGTVLVEPSCTINNNQTIEVEFNEVMTTRIDGVNYKQPINYVLSCDTSYSSSFKMSIQGGVAGFGTGILATNETNDLGIELYSGTQKVNVNSWINFNYSNKPTLYAVPVKRGGATLTGGDFSAAATMLIAYQ